VTGGRPHSREQLRRWQQRSCCRCGHLRHVTAWWPEGTICRTCHDRALLVRGHCPRCREHRVLPGRGPEGQPLCTDCSGFRTSYRCRCCDHEGKLHAGKLCTRCMFTDRLTELLDDGTGQIHPGLRPLFEALIAMDNPLTGLTWLYKPYAPRFLRGLASGEIALTHEAFHQLEPWRAAAHLRELLMSCGLLPAVDKQLLLFERWLGTFLPSITEASHARLIRQFATWQVLPWLRRRATKRPLAPNTRSNAGAQLSRALEFLDWLAGHQRGLRECSQADLDRWHAEHLGHHRQALKPFQSWAMRTRRMPRLEVPLTPVPQRAPITQHHRLTLLRRLLTDDAPPLRVRVAAVLLLLYAQPLSRIVRLTVDDIITVNGEVLIRFGEPPTPVPGLFAELVLALVDQRPNMRTATNPNSRWLFPGRRAGQPLHPETLGKLIAKNGLPSTTGRVAALRQLVLQAPAPVVADALGVHYSTAHRHLTDAGGTWKTYAPGDHSPPR
jgi:hypothetical protein